MRRFIHLLGGYPPISLDLLIHLVTAGRVQLGFVLPSVSCRPRLVMHRLANLLTKAVRPVNTENEARPNWSQKGARLHQCFVRFQSVRFWADLGAVDHPAGFRAAVKAFRNQGEQGAYQRKKDRYAQQEPRPGCARPSARPSAPAVGGRSVGWLAGTTVGPAAAVGRPLGGRSVGWPRAR